MGVLHSFCSEDRREEFLVLRSPKIEEPSSIFEEPSIFEEVAHTEFYILGHNRIYNNNNNNHCFTCPIYMIGPRVQPSLMPRSRTFSLYYMFFLLRLGFLVLLLFSLLLFLFFNKCFKQQPISRHVWLQLEARSYP